MNGYVLATYLVTIGVLGATAVRIVVTERHLRTAEQTQQAQQAPQEQAPREGRS
jgi:hypothetical protein